MQGGGRGRRRVWQAVFAFSGVAVAACGVWTLRALVRGGLEPQDTAGVVGLLVAVLALVVSVVGLRRSPWEPVDSPMLAEDLAARVMELETFQRRQLLGADHVAIDVGFRVREQARSAVVEGPSGPVSAGRLGEIGSFYGCTRYGRVVLTGQAGAGKTVLAVELVLALLENRGPEDLVPVRLALAGWDTHRAFEDWLAERLVEEYDRHPAVARLLVRQGRVLPVLDGLDEMDPAAASPAAAPRARAALETLNGRFHGRSPAPVVLTCRAEQYEVFSGAGRGLRDSAWIDLAPVTADQARRYLDGRALTNAWQPVLDELGRHPQGPLAAALSTPWQLTLAATVYADGGDPEQLCARAADGSVQAHLLAEFLPASVRLHPWEPGRYDTQAVQRWLGLLADHLRTMPSAVGPMPWSSGSTGTGVADSHPPAAPDRDIVRHRLWLLAGPRRVRLIHLAVCTALVALAAVGFGLLASLTRPTPPLPFVVGAAVVVCLWGLLQWSQPWPQPRKLVPYRRLGPGDSCLVSAGMLAAMFATVMSIMADMTQRFPVSVLTALGVVTALVMLTSTAFLGKATSQPADAADRTVSDPRLLLRGDLVSGLLVAVVFGLVVGVGAGGTMGASYGVALGVVSLCAVILVANAWTRYVMLLLCTRRLLPWRLGTFLDWAYRGGLLRISGNAYQFRHRELQDWLAHQSGTSPRDSGWVSVPR
ncbi:NACHT domain-containing protein [Streptomyces sp. NPDC056479]|uniref:NACHT domain-containing protein n=1 Tax=Streptomyces sp. NPDC056479 TaxID=3345832 RepID=UPI0036C858E9